MAFYPYKPICDVNGVDCCGHHARRNTPVTPSQMAKIGKLANDLYWGRIEASERDAIGAAEAHVMQMFDADPRDIDARCQPEKMRPEGCR